MDTNADTVFLESKGWTRVSDKGTWCWRQPNFMALFRKDDALETQRALDREQTIRKKQ